MKNVLVCGFTFLAALAFAPSSVYAAEARSATPDPDATVAAAEMDGVPTDAPVVLFLTREEHAKALARQPLARPSPNLTWHGGPILTDSAVRAIFWGPSWSDSTFTGDKISGLDSFYVGFNGSNYAGTNTEYSGTNGQVTTGSTLGSNLVDTTNATGGGKTAPILAEVCKMIPNPVANGYYPVYTDLPRGHARYCAWHSWGTCGSPAVNVQFAFFWNLDSDAGCDPGDLFTSHSQGLAALANVSGHELSEAVTDPRGTGWYDSQGAENADKCAWTFGSDTLTLSNGAQFRVQGNWSNAAYTGGWGYTKGCIDGNQHP